jgi:hypothetical protein
MIKYCDRNDKIKKYCLQCNNEIVIKFKSKESKKFCSVSCSSKWQIINNPNVGFKGKSLSEEHKGKLSDKLKGRIFSDETRKLLSVKLKGRCITEECRKKISNTLKGRHLPEEQKHKISESLKREKNYMWKGEIIDTSTYTSIYVKGDKRKSLHRYIWEEANGLIPEGYHIHHIDGNRKNNELINLQLVTPGEHNKIHHGKKVIEETE